MYRLHVIPILYIIAGNWMAAMSTYQPCQPERVPGVGEADSSIQYTQQEGHLPSGTTREEKRLSQTRPPLYTKNEEENDDDNCLTLATKELDHHTITSIIPKKRQDSLDFVIAVSRAKEGRGAATHPSSSACGSLSTSSSSNIFDQKVSSRPDHQSAGTFEVARS